MKLRSKFFAIWVFLCIALGTLLSWLSGMPIWGGILIVAVALLINGLIAEVEDSEPGGFFNPRDKEE